MNHPKSKPASLLLCIRHSHNLSLFASPRIRVMLPPAQSRFRSSPNQQRRLTMVAHRQAPDHRHPNTEEDHGYFTLCNTRTGWRSIDHHGSDFFTY
jgi:hypothetical protein